MKIIEYLKFVTENFYRKQAGFSVIEIVLAVSIFMILSTGTIAVILQGLDSNRLGEEQTVANQYASEGIEAVRSIKNQAYTNLTAVNPTPRAVNPIGGVWTFGADGTSNQFGPNNKYIRTVKVDPVSRDGVPPLGNIVVSGTNDPDTKKITSTVSWNFTPSRVNSVALSSYLSDWKKPIVGGGPIIMVYSETTSTPFYRTWGGSSWSTESSAQVVGGNINYIVLKSSRTRNEAVLGTMDSNGNIYAQVWNGTSWSTPTLMANVGSALALFRSFDIDYEKSGDRAMFVYLPNATSADPAYRIWDGASWSSAITVTAPPTTGVIRWIDITQNPISTSNEIAMIMLDANTDVYGIAWDGSTWGTMGTGVVWDATAAIATEKVIDVAYEQTSGRAMFVWGDSVATDQYYRIWNGSGLAAATLLDIPAAGGVANWIELVSRPSSDELMYGVLDGGSDLNTRKWSGSTWDIATQHPEHTAGAENNSSMAFDIIFETHSSNPGEAWLMYGNGATVSKKQWTGAAWGAGSVLTGSDDTSFVRLKADPVSGSIFAGIYEDSTSATDDIWESRLTGGGTTWSAKNSIWGGPTSATPVFFRIDIAAP